MALEGVWVERDGVRRQLEPLSKKEWLVSTFQFSLGPVPVDSRTHTSLKSSLPSSFSAGCVVGVRVEALDAFIAGKVGLGDRSKSEPIPWEDVKISFLLDEQVQVKVGDRLLEPRTCKELQDAGFWDRHQKKPAKVWGVLQVLAMHNGTQVVAFEERKHVENGCLRFTRSFVRISRARVSR